MGSKASWVVVLTAVWSDGQYDRALDFLWWVRSPVYRWAEKNHILSITVPQGRVGGGGRRPESHVLIPLHFIGPQLGLLMSLPTKVFIVIIKTTQYNN